MIKEEVREKLLEMKEQYIFEITGGATRFVMKSYDMLKVA